MQRINITPFLAGAVTTIIAAAATFGVRSFARKYGFIARPTTDRWHKKPTAMLGGVAIFLAAAAGFFVFVPYSPESLVLFASSTLLFVVGLIDDLVSIRPYQKLIAQLAGAGLLVMFGLKLPITGYEIVDIWITVFWVVGITNAINLLDNMDGLAAGISVIASVSLAFNFSANGLTSELLLASVMIGALLGFLFFNFNPASIFMGDCGSMFLGFLLSGSVLLNRVGGRSRGIVAILAVPVLILFVPIFDTTFVTLLRKAWGRKASQGGRDHTSHRLVALGLSERSAVLMLYAFAIIAGALALVVSQVGTLNSFALIGLFCVVLVILGVYLSKVKVYEGEDVEKAAAENAVFAFLINVTYKRRIFEVFLDAFLITLAYYSAFSLLYGSPEGTANWDLFLSTLPILILVKLASFLVVGVYRGLWRYTSVGDLITFAKGVILGSAVSVLTVLVLYRFVGFSRTVFFLDGVLLLLGVVGSRIAFRLIRQMLPLPVSPEGRNVLIYGAGDGGEMVLRELNNNPSWAFVPVGFIDDDPLKKNKVIHGLTVYECNSSLAEICDQRNVKEILISVRTIQPDRLRWIREYCRDANIDLKRAQIRIEPIELS
ncbi:MAG: hypothetical protein JO053_12075 [Acidobacteria bacterium]|nr:hypothetical protein [Acidobacteriota bacterium]